MIYESTMFQPEPRRSAGPWPYVTFGALALALLIAVATWIVVANRGPAQAQPAPAATADPYALYLSLAPDDAPDLTREEAQARAILGCGQRWAPGTTDAALAQAYGHLCHTPGG